MMDRETRNEIIDITIAVYDVIDELADKLADKSQELLKIKWLLNDIVREEIK